MWYPSHPNLPGFRHAYSSALARSADPGLIKEYSAGQGLRSFCQQTRKLYLILSGYSKTSVISEIGDEDIIGFSMQGDLLGLGALSPSPTNAEAIFLSDATVAELTIEDAMRLDRAIGGFDEGVGDLISRELLRTQWRNRCVRYPHADTRVAQFLLELGRRFEEMDLAPNKFRLFMPREDLAIFLGMTRCTLSRTIQALCRRRLIVMDGSRWVEILDPVQLNRV